MDSIIRDLLDIAVTLVRKKVTQSVKKKAENIAMKRVIDVIAGSNPAESTRKVFEKQFKDGELDDDEISIALTEQKASSNIPMMDVPGASNAQMGILNLGDIFSKAIGGADKKKVVKLKVKEAYKRAIEEESDKLIDQNQIVAEAIYKVENDGIVFIDEIDKITSKHTRGEVSREGVQRDLLPLIEGSTIATKYGHVNTDHILFIAAGAFHSSKPSDLLPELQGRLPIKVELKALTIEDLIRILSTAEYNLVMQYQALLGVEGVEINFTEEAICKLAGLAEKFNTEIENTGARRLSTIIEKLLEELNFSASDISGTTVTIDLDYVEKHLSDFMKEDDISRFII